MNLGSEGEEAGGRIGSDAALELTRPLRFHTEKIVRAETQRGSFCRPIKRSEMQGLNGHS